MCRDIFIFLLLRSGRQYFSSLSTRLLEVNVLSSKVEQFYRGMIVMSRVGHP